MCGFEWEGLQHNRHYGRRTTVNKLFSKILNKNYIKMVKLSYETVIFIPITQTFGIFHQTLEARVLWRNER